MEPPAPVHAAVEPPDEHHRCVSAAKLVSPVRPYTREMPKSASALLMLPTRKYFIDASADARRRLWKPASAYVQKLDSSRPMKSVMSSRLPATTIMPTVDSSSRL